MNLIALLFLPDTKIWGKGDILVEKMGAFQNGVKLSYKPRGFQMLAYFRTGSLQ